MTHALVRRGTPADLPFMLDMLYEAATIGWVLSSEAPPPKADVLAHPSNRHYTEGWGRRGDTAIIAEDEAHQPLGAAWYRVYTPSDRGDGIVAWPGAPEVAIGVRPEARGAGIGRMLLDALAQAARDSAYARLVLSVDPRNPARRLYERCGYRVVPEGGPHAGTSLIMELLL